MRVYKVISSSYRAEKVIANNIDDAINKYLLNGKDIEDVKTKDIEHKLNSIIKVEYLEDFDYIQ